MGSNRHRNQNRNTQAAITDAGPARKARPHRPTTRVMGLMLSATVGSLALSGVATAHPTDTHPAPARHITEAAHPTPPPPASLDDACKAVNDWLAENNFPERIDCAAISDPETLCAEANDLFEMTSAPVRLDCCTLQIVPATDPPTSCDCPKKVVAPLL